MSTINISLPEKLKEDADYLVKKGFYSSFSDLVRDSLRSVIARTRYDLWYEEAKMDVETGKAAILKSNKDVDNYFRKI